MDDLYRDLLWLPPQSPDFVARCRNLPKAMAAAGNECRELATARLNIEGLHKLANAMDRAAAQDVSMKPLDPFNLGLVSNATTSFLPSCIRGTAPRFGLDVTIYSGGYGQAMQALIDADSALHTTKLDAILLSLDHRAFPFKAALGNVETETAMVDAAIARLNAMREQVHRFGVPAIVQTLPAVPDSLFGNLDRSLAGTLRRFIDQFNYRVAELLSGSSDVLLDVAHLVETIGSSRWHDRVQWFAGKFPCSQDYLPLYADHICRVLAAMRGKSRRCLILDLDNTLWGGVIGDDELSGIVLGQGSAVGEAHVAVQEAALDLHGRGIVLAVSSKNDEAVARLPFERHPEMLLKMEHIAVFQANWDDKVSNIKSIAETLNLGIDSMVLLDDNPVERGLVRKMLPTVAVPEIGDDPALFVTRLLAAGYFESVAFSQEDRKRTEFYRQDALRRELQVSSGDMNAYLKSLEMVVTAGPFDENSRPRVAQLVNKTNQFNLTTRRYTEAEIAALESGPKRFHSVGPCVGYLWGQRTGGSGDLS